MNMNPAIQNTALVAWDGSMGTPRPIDGHVAFGWSFEILDNITTDTVFDVFYHDADPADPCLPGPAQIVEEVPICGQGTLGAPQTITIPAGSLQGSVAAATLPCLPGKFVSLNENDGDTDLVRAVIVLHGPKS